MRTTTDGNPSGRRHDLTAALGPARRLLFRHRRLLAAACVFVAVLATVSALRPAPEPTVDVVVAARDVPAGTRLTDADLRVTAWPRRWAPPGLLGTPSMATDRLLVSPVAAGEAITRTRLIAGVPVGDRSGTPGPVPDGMVAAPVRISDAGAVSLVSAGDHVDVVAAREATSGPTAEVVARDARVLAVPRRSGAAGGGLLTASSGDAGAASGTLLVLAVPAPTAVALARESVSGRLSLLLHVA